MRTIPAQLVHFLVVILMTALAAAAPPSGFIVQPIGGTWNEIAGIAFLEDGRSIAWERGGRLWMIEADGTRHATPMLDISEEVGGWRDHGLLSVAPHPNYLNNGRLYLLYVVDRHHLLNFGTPQYDSNQNWYFAATIGRVTRYTALAESGFSQVDPATRKILLGESASTGIPIVHQSHGVGTILFGEDGTLLVSVGDSASYESNDFGGQVSGGYVAQALNSGILTAAENVGAFRAQLLNTHCGKILRLDPETGDGVPSNPFFDPAAPRAAKSRVWCLGLRNPFRMELLPGSGSHNPAAGRPGTLLIGDVGWNVREELNVTDQPGLNFGWPIFEGLDWLNAYATNGTVNQDAPNPLAGQAGGPICFAPFFSFRDLLIHDTLDPEPMFVNPCGLFQAEHEVLSGAVPSAGTPGFSGTGYVIYPNPSGDFIEWKLPVASSATWRLHFRYALGASEGRALRITVDGVEVAAALEFPSTGSSSRYRWVTIDVPLEAGNRLVRATAIGQGGPNMDGFAITALDGAVAEIPQSIPRFTHRRPIIDWVHGAALAHVPGFIGEVPAEFLVGSPQSGVAGQSFKGSCAIGGSRVEAGMWPPEWQGTYLFGDYADQYIRGLTLASDGSVSGVKVFDPLAGWVAMVRYNPVDDALWVVRWGNQLMRIRYAPNTNQAPVISVTATPTYGPSPLAVTFDASDSFDPEGTPLTFEWSFPDGSRPAEGAVVQHVFSGRGPERHDVLLTLRDGAGIESSRLVPIWTDNTPPQVRITSVRDGDLYSMEADTLLPLTASIFDAEHAAEDLSCAWTTILHHNTHSHAEPVDPACATETLISPLGCGEETYYYEIVLTVTDPLGLATTEALFIYPDCKGRLSCSADFNGDGLVDGADLGLLLSAWGETGPGLAADLNSDQVIDGADLGLLLAAWGSCT